MAVLNGIDLMMVFSILICFLGSKAFSVIWPSPVYFRMQGKDFYSCSENLADLLNKPPA